MSKRAELRAKREREKRQQGLILGLVITGVVLIITAIILLPNLRPIGDIVLPERLERPMADGVAMGNPDAPVIIEEFSDFGCYYCGRFSRETEPALVENYIANGQVYFIYRQFPLGPASIPVSEASYCAAEQNLFWDYHDVLFANQDENDPNALSERRLIAFAEGIGADVEEFERCLTEGRYKDAVQADYQAGRAAGIESTPTFFVNGLEISGAQPYAVFQEAIEAALLASGE